MTNSIPKPIRHWIALAGALTALSALSACGQASPAASEPADAASDSVAAGSASSADPAVAALNGKITFGTEGTYSPFSYHDESSGELTGYDVEVAKAVGEKLGLRVEFAETTWDSIFAALESDRFTAIANEVELTDERKEKYDLSDPYSVSYPVAITKADDSSITSVADLKGKTAAQTPGSNWGSKAEGYGAKVETVPGFSESVAAIRDGRADFTLNDALAALDYFKTTNDTSVKVALEITDDKVYQGFAFKKDSGLLPAVNQALSELSADGTLAQLGEKYFGKDISK
ncbi:MAG: transporter substrate-binding domain-containing protein [Propionibacteriaceae bacterium]|jgi:ABC-type amino acid transport substrate-binding protein|nr:transporter substrate-binding domain-containing protein [Propionibacteriaceae bacterium]